METEAERRSRRPALVAAAVAAACLALAPWIAAAEDEGEPRALPRTIDKVWYRGEKNQGWGGLKPARASGDLTITEDSLELSGKKEAVSIPLSALVTFSVGKMKGDVNTDWVVLRLDEGGATRVIGIRDGKKLGYGQRTKDIHEDLRRIMKQLGAGQFRAAPGLQPFAKFDAQVVFSVPEGWFEHPHRVTYVGDWRGGVVVFSPERVEPGPQVESVLLGRQQAVIARLEQAPAGMTCDKAPKKAVARLLEQTETRLRDDEDLVLQGSLSSTPVEVDGCRGLRIEGLARPDYGGDVVHLERLVVAHGSAVLTLELRSPDPVPEAWREQLERVAATVRFAAAKG